MGEWCHIGDFDCIACFFAYGASNLEFRLHGEVLYAKSIPGLRPSGHPADVPIRSWRIGHCSAKEK